MAIRICGDNTVASPAITSASDTDTGLQFGTNEVKVVNGNLDITDGNLKFASGHGIDFSATGDGSGTVVTELFNDYEEGIWTPTIINGGSFTVNAARYLKIGHRVSAYLYAQSITGIPNTTAEFRIGGLPYSAKTVSNVFNFGSNVIAFAAGASSNFATYRGFVAPGQNNFYFHEIGQVPIRQNTHVQATLNGQSLLMTVEYLAV